MRRWSNADYRNTIINVVTLVMSFTVYDVVWNVDRYTFKDSPIWLPRLKILRLTSYQPRMALQYINFIVMIAITINLQWLYLLSFSSLIYFHVADFTGGLSNLLIGRGSGGQVKTCMYVLWRFHIRGYIECKISYIC